MNNIRKILTGTFLLMSLSSLQAKDVVVLVDYSESITQEEWKNYDKAFMSMVNSLKVNDKISLMPIGTQTQGSAVIFSSITLADKGHPLVSKKENNKLLKSFMSVYIQKKKEMAGKEGSTRIASSLRAAAEVLQSSPQSNKTILILSDMLDSTNEFPMADFNNGQCSKEQNIVDKAKKPNLNGFSIIVRGAGGGSDDGYACVKSFWSHYLMSAGASEIDYARNNPL